MGLGASRSEKVAVVAPEAALDSACAVLRHLESRNVARMLLTDATEDGVEKSLRGVEISRTVLSDSMLLSTALTSIPDRIIVLIPDSRTTNAYGVALSVVESVRKVGPALKQLVWISEGCGDDFLATRVSHYDALRATSEVLENAGLPLLQVETATTFQQLDRTLRLGEQLTAGHGLWRCIAAGIAPDADLSYVDARDVAEAAAAAVTTHPPVAAGRQRWVGECFSLKDFAEDVSAVLNAGIPYPSDKPSFEVVYEQVPASEVEAAAVRSGADPQAAREAAITQAAMAAGHCPVRTCKDASDLKKLLGRAPRTMRAYLEESAAGWKAAVAATTPRSRTGAKGLAGHGGTTLITEDLKTDA